MATQPSTIPPNVALYLREQITHRSTYKAEKEEKRIPPKWLQPDYDEYLAEIARLDGNISNITSTVIIPMAKKYCSWVEIDETNPEMTVANILAALPAPEEVVVKKIFHGSA